MTIVVLGIFVADTAFRAERQPKMGETILGTDFRLGPGGKGSNQAVAAARAGGEVHFITRLGKDDFAQLAHKTWAEAGVRPAVIEDGESYTGAAYIFIEAKSGNNAIIVSPGAAGRFDLADVERQAELIGSAKVFLTQLEQPVSVALKGLELAKAGGAHTILNPAPAAELPTGMLGLCDFVTPNESEAEGLTGIAVNCVASARAAATRLREMGAGAALITLGAQGAFFDDGARDEHIEPFDAGPVVETTGAGDAFNGAFSVAIAEGRDALDAARFGCAAGAMSVTRPGAAPSMPERPEIDQIFDRR